jgi:hypothetical protein
VSGGRGLRVSVVVDRGRAHSWVGSGAGVLVVASPSGGIDLSTRVGVERSRVAAPRSV